MARHELGRSIKLVCICGKRYLRLDPFLKHESACQRAVAASVCIFVYVCVGQWPAAWIQKDARSIKETA